MGREADIRPFLGAGGVPWCDDACPSYDGKRCSVIGRKPDALCEPAVAALVADIAAARAATPRIAEGAGVLTVDEAFMHKWAERLDASRSELRRLLEEVGVGVTVAAPSGEEPADE